MPRATYNEAYIEQALNKVLSLAVAYSDEAKEEFRKDFLRKKEVDHNIRMAERLVRGAASSVSKFNELILGVSGCGDILDQLFSDNPRSILILGSTPNTLGVYPNLILDSFDTDSMENCGGIFSSTALNTFKRKYAEDMASDITKQRWELRDRASKYIRKYQEFPIATALTRYGGLSAFTSDRIRDFADAIHDLRKPVELQFAETPRDFTMMYGSGPRSCISFGAQGRENWQALTAVGLCPASWYAYCPYTKGAYIKHGNQVVARAICFDIGDKWYYGRVFFNTGQYHEKFVDALELAGIEKLEDDFSPESGIEFKIPGVLMGAGNRNPENNSYMAPWPYFDDMPREGGYWGMSFNRETKEFTFGYECENLEHTPANRIGYQTTDDLIVRRCSNCLTRENSLDYTFYATNDGNFFCSYDCAIEMDYIRVIQADGGLRYERPDPYQIMCLPHEDYFSTTEAARVQGVAYPLMNELGVMPEEGEHVADSTYAWILTHSAVGRVRVPHHVFDYITSKAGGRNLLPKELCPNVDISDIKFQKNVMYNSADPLVSYV